jgi:hypothetical protein
VWYATVTTNVDIEFVGLAVIALFVNSLKNLGLGPSSLATSNNLAVSLGGQQVVT